MTYGTPVDIWALGCLIYQMFTSALPFVDYMNTKAMHIKILKNKLNMDKYPVLKSNTKAKGFITSCLTSDPKKRPSASLLLNHTWFN